jgi:hypothetical protein
MNVTATNIRIPRSIHDVACSLNILNIKVLLSITPTYRRQEWYELKMFTPLESGDLLTGFTPYY